MTNEITLHITVKIAQEQLFTFDGNTITLDKYPDGGLFYQNNKALKKFIFPEVITSLHLFDLINKSYGVRIMNELFSIELDDYDEVIIVESIRGPFARAQLQALNNSKVNTELPVKVVYRINMATKKVRRRIYIGNEKLLTDITPIFRKSRIADGLRSLLKSDKSADSDKSECAV